jgi:hypothetical protein
MSLAMKADLLTAQIMAAGLAAGFDPPNLLEASGNASAELEYQADKGPVEQSAVTGWGSDDEDPGKIEEGVPPPASPAPVERSTPAQPKRSKGQKATSPGRAAAHYRTVVPVGVTPVKARRWAEAHAEMNQELTLRPMINKNSARIAEKMKLAPLTSPERARLGRPASSGGFTAPNVPNGAAKASVTLATSSVMAASKVKASARSLHASEVHAERARKARQAAAPPTIGRQSGLAPERHAQEQFRPVINQRSKELIGKRPIPPKALSKEQEHAVVQCARWVVQYGDAFESVVAEKNQGNPLFNFLAEAKAVHSGGIAARPSPAVRFFIQRKAYERLLAEKKPIASAIASATPTPVSLAKKTSEAPLVSAAKKSHSQGDVDPVDFLLARKSPPVTSRETVARTKHGSDSYARLPRTPTGQTARQSAGSKRSASADSRAVVSSLALPKARPTKSKPRGSLSVAATQSELPKTRMFRDPVSSHSSASSFHVCFLFGLLC